MNRDPHLRQFYDRWDRLEQEKAATQADLRELFAEMKATGYDAKAARLAFRTKAKQDDETDADRAFDATVELYVAALGTPVATRAPAPAPAREEPPHDPETGEVHETEPGEGRAAASVPASPAAPSVPSAGGAFDERPGDYELQKLVADDGWPKPDLEAARKLTVDDIAIPEALRRTRAA